MKWILQKKNMLILTSIAILFTGCLISGTFVINEKFTLNGNSGFYYYQIDITGESDWQDHKDDIDNIDVVGFELWFTNNGATDVTFNTYVDDFYNPLCTDTNCLNNNSTKIKIIDNLKLIPGSTHITYGQSFQYLVNIDQLRQLAKEGQFNFYGVSSPGGVNISLDSAQVVVTVSASGT